MDSMARSGDFGIRYKQRRQKGRNRARGVLNVLQVGGASQGESTTEGWDYFQYVQWGT
jgi:hypothetical protein